MSQQRSDNPYLDASLHNVQLDYSPQQNHLFIDKFRIQNLDIDTKTNNNEQNDQPITQENNQELVKNHRHNSSDDVKFKNNIDKMIGILINNDEKKVDIEPNDSDYDDDDDDDDDSQCPPLEDADDVDDTDATDDIDDDNDIKNAEQDDHLTTNASMNIQKQIVDTKNDDDDDNVDTIDNDNDDDDDVVLDMMNDNYQTKQYSTDDSIYGNTSDDNDNDIDDEKDDKKDDKTDIDIVTEITSILSQEFDNNVVNAFKQYVSTEFDEDQMKDNIIEDLCDDIEDSGIIDGINNKLNWNQNKLTKLFKLLRKIVKIDNNNSDDDKDNSDDDDDDFDDIYDLYNNPDPSKLMSLKRIRPPYINPHKFDLNISPQELLKAETYLTRTLTQLPYDRRDALNTSSKLRVIGYKNFLPAFSVMLWDTYTTYRVRHLTDKYDPSAKDVVSFPYFQKLPSLIKDFETFMNYFVEPKGCAPKIQYRPLTRINDREIIFAHYTFALNRLIKKLLNSNDVYPLQLDMWIIPSHVQQKKMKVHEIIFDDADDDDNEYLREYRRQKAEESSEDENSVDNTNIYGMRTAHRANEYVSDIYVYEDRIFDISTRLNMSNGAPTYVSDYINVKQCESLSDNDINKTMIIIYNKLVELSKLLKCNKDKRGACFNGFKYKRFIIIIDRRVQSYDAIFEDRFFIYKPPPTYSEFPQDYCEEHMLMMTKEYVIGNTDRMHFYKHCGGYTDFTGHQFSISFHIHDPHLIRAYWYYNGSVTRFFPHYLHTLWPRYFVSQSPLDTVSESVVKSKWIFEFEDRTFEQWLRMTVGEDTTITHIPTEVIGQSDHYNKY